MGSLISCHKGGNHNIYDMRYEVDDDGKIEEEVFPTTRKFSPEAASVSPVDKGKSVVVMHISLYHKILRTHRDKEEEVF